MFILGLRGLVLYKHFVKDIERLPEKIKVSTVIRFSN